MNTNVPEPGTRYDTAAATAAAASTQTTHFFLSRSDQASTTTGTNLDAVFACKSFAQRDCNHEVPIAVNPPPR